MEEEGLSAVPDKDAKLCLDCDRPLLFIPRDKEYYCSECIESFPATRILPSDMAVHVPY